MIFLVYAWLAVMLTNRTVGYLKDTISRVLANATIYHVRLYAFLTYSRYSVPHQMPKPVTVYMCSFFVPALHLWSAL